jgi:hypothetical protein
MKKLGLILSILFLYSQLQAAALKGIVYDHKGEVLPFASVYIQGTSIGTTTNVEGEYSLELKPGTYQIIYKYVGYQQELVEITMEQVDVLKDIQLKALDLEMEEVVIVGGEDPAYPIIRKAIKKRKYYLNQVESYSCDAYVKGTQYVKDMPEKFMGRSLGEFRKGLDSTGSGIVYLSESVAKLYFDKKEYKEIMISSKVSGDDNGFSFNSGVAMSEFNFYQNQLSLGDSKLLSPIANTALLAYKYQLIATFEDDGRLINKIKVIPKNPLGQLFHGEIYIVEDEWCIHSTALRTTGKAANISMLDTVEFRQLHLPVKDSIWRLFSQEVEFNMKIFAVRLAGRFTGVFHNYELNPDYEDKFFGAEVFRVDETANQRDSVYWNEVRPIPLTAAERREYVLKDSLQKIWKSKAYRDSMDRISNRPSLSMLLSGYTFRRTHQNWRISIPSPISTIQFNTIQGWYGHLEGTFAKGFDEDWTSWLDVHAELEYGLADRQIRGFGRFRYKFNDTNDARIELEGGRKTAQYAPLEPITPLVNSLYSLILRCNYLKLYEKRFIRAEYSQRLLNGLLFFGQIEYAQRHALVNNTDYSWSRREGSYFSNQPLDFNDPPFADIPAFATHQILRFDLFMRLRFGQKFVSYPKRRFHMGSKYPEIWIQYTKALPILGTDMDFDYLGLTIQKDEWSLGGMGLLTARAKLAFFPNTSNMEFIDYMHFSGNQTVYAKSGQQWRSYQLMPYYECSTNEWFTELHLHHDFNGVIWNKLPLLKHLGFEVVAGYHFLYTPDQQDYMEFTIGLDRLGWNLLRFGRVDFVMAYESGSAIRPGVVFGIDFSL